MYDAEQQNSTLRADVNYMENYKALEDIKDFEKLQLSGGVQFSLQKKATAGGSKLPTLGAAMMQDPHMQNQVDEMKSENDKLKMMMGALQMKLS